MGEIVTFLLFLGGIAAAVMLWALVSEIVAVVEDFRCGDCGKLVVASVGEPHHCEECNQRHFAKIDKPITPPLDSEAVERAVAWLRQCSDWLMSTDLDMQCPMETDPLEIAEGLLSLAKPVGGDSCPNCGGQAYARGVPCSFECSRALDRLKAATQSDKRGMVDE